MCAALGLIIPLFHEISAKSMLGIAAAKIAKYSYGIYIFHVPAMWFSLAILKNAPLALRVACLAVLTIVTPILAYHAIEKPLIQLGKRLTTGAFAEGALASGSEISLIEPGS
jgi:peptidoglycan/LPS O-acetylase OafA/YrhL